MANPYETLGVAPTASQDDIRKAYRKAAKETHPDLNPGKPEAESRFKEINAAYDIIGDADKRKRYDAGEIDGVGLVPQAESHHVGQVGVVLDHQDAHAVSLTGSP